jgi:hypothetical protein
MQGSNENLFTATPEARGHSEEFTMASDHTSRIYRTLSSEGYRAVRAWVQANCRGGGTQPLDYWYGYAQNVLDKTPDGMALTVEMPARDTLSGEHSVLELLTQHITVEAEAEAA